MNARVETPAAVATEVAHDAIVKSVADGLTTIALRVRASSSLHHIDQEVELCKLIDRLDHERSRLVSALEAAQELADRSDPDADELRWNAEHSVVTP